MTQIGAALTGRWAVGVVGLAQQKVVRALRNDLLKNILRQEISFFDTTSTGELSSRITSDCSEMVKHLGFARLESCWPNGKS